jgi:hypothetical protein
MINHIRENNAGNYKVKVSNCVGSVESENAILNIEI